MKDHELTKKQRLALDSTRNIAVTAGAGTGKTFMLVERYLDILINHDVDIRQILAITFTKKAAAEMMTRVANRIESLLDEKSSVGKRERLIQIRDYLSAAYISTIHSFCARILREYPVEAGIDPDFVQLSDMQYEILFDETFNEVIGELDKEESYWLDLFRSVRLWSIEEMLRESLTHRFELRSVLERFENNSPEMLYDELIKNYLHDAHQRIDRQKTNQVIDQVDIILEKLINSDPEYTEIKVLFDLKNAGGPDKVDFWRALISLRNEFTTGQNKAYSNLRYLRGKDFWGDENAANALLLSELMAGFDDLPEPAPGPSDLRLLQVMAKFFELYHRIEERFSRKKRMYNTVDYEDLQLLVYDLIRSDDDLRQKISARFMYIMVDEFQDTNPLQWAIIGLLGDLEDNKYFIVGDPKQSIYGFRNADVRVFQNVKQSFIMHAPQEETLTDIVLEDSFRFKENLTGFINTLFAGIMHKDADGEWEVSYDTMICKRKDAADGQTEIALLDENVQPEFIAASIQNLKQRQLIDYGDIAILLRTRNRLTDIEEQLRHQGIPFKTIGGIGFFQRQEIYDVYHLVRFLISPDDDIALVGLLRSPFADISDAGVFMLSRIEETGGYWQKLLKADGASGIPVDDWTSMQRFRTLAKTWLYLRDRMSFNELLDNIFNRSGFRAVYAADNKAPRYLANLDKILEQAVELEQAGFTSLADFGEALQNLIRSQIQESEAPLEIEDKTTVKIMTVHQAKGLEFPVVFVPFLEQKVRPAAYGGAIFDEIYGFAPTLSGEDGNGMLQHIIRQRARQKAIAELKRLFYVACTRAMNHLILLGTIDDGKVPADTPLGWLIDKYDLDIENSDNRIHEPGIMIWRTLPESEKTIGPDSGQILKNISWLREQVNNRRHTGDIPDCFMTLEDQPEWEVFSATQLMMYDQNPTEYFERYHLGYFESDYDFSLRTDTDEDTALLRGKLIHKYFEEYPDFDLTRSLYEYEITDNAMIERLSREVRETVARIGGSAQISEILAAQEYINEVSVMRKIGSDLLTGTIDRMYRNRHGLWEIIDYKTNRISVSDVEQVAHKYQLQLNVYALLLAGLHPGQEYYQVNLYFTQIDVLHPTVYKPDDLHRCENKIRETIDGIKGFSPYASG